MNNRKRNFITTTACEKAMRNVINLNQKSYVATAFELNKCFIKEQNEM